MLKEVGLKGVVTFMVVSLHLGLDEHTSKYVLNGVNIFV